MKPTFVLRRIAALTLACALPIAGLGQTFSRDVSVLLPSGGSRVGDEAVSRSVSVHLSPGEAVGAREAWSRAVSVHLAPGEGVTTKAALSRAVSVHLSPGLDVAKREAVSRAVSVHLPSGNGAVFGPAVSREVSVVLPDVVLPPPADLEVTSVKVLPGAGIFGSPVRVEWVVRNRGEAPATGAWRDRVVLRNAVLGREWLLAVVEVEGPLPEGGERTIATEVRLPLEAGLPPGGWEIAVVVDPERSVREDVVSNNTETVGLTLAYPPLPDLAVSAVTAAGVLVPGGSVEVAWGVSRSTAVGVAAGWVESVRLVRADAEVQTLETRVVDGAAPDALGMRRVRIGIPTGTRAGAARIEVIVDAGDAIVEEREDNNRAQTSEVLEVARVLGWGLAQTRVLESDAPLVAILTRNSAVDAALDVVLASDDTTELMLPASVTIPAGRSSVAVPLAPVADGVADPDVSVRIRATAAGHESAEIGVVVANVDRPRLVVELPGNSIVEGERWVARVRRDGELGAALEVNLTTSAEADVSVPRRVLIPAGSAEAEFELAAIPNLKFEPTRTRLVSATAARLEGGTTSVAVVDDDPVSLGLKGEAQVLEGSRWVLSVTRTMEGQPVPTGELKVRLQVPGGGLAIASEVRFAPGVGTVHVEGLAPEDTLVNGERRVEVRAQAYFEGTSQLAGAPVAVFVQVTDNDVPALALQVEPGAVREELASAAVGRVTRNSGTNTPLTVRLQAEDPSVVQVPATVEIGAGEAFAEFPLSTGPVVPGREAVGLMATAIGHAEGRASLRVSDADLPDITVAAVLLNPTTQVTDGLVNVGLRIANLGTKGYRGGSSYRIWLSEDDLIGDDRLVAAGTVPDFDRELSRGAEFSLTVPVFLGTVPGIFRVVAELDADQQLVELDERNNARLGDTALTVVPEYSAMVTTTVETMVSGGAVPLRGVATLDPMLGGGPTPRGKPVSIHVQHRGATRVFTAFTDATGAFALDFQPLPGEAGQYRVGATHPGAALTVTTDGFAVLDVVFQPRALELSVIDGTAADVVVQLVNPGESPLTGVTLAAEEVPANLRVELALPGTVVAAGGKLSVPVRVTAEGALPARGECVLRVTTSEGVVRRMPVSVTVEPKRARLVVEPGSVETGVVRGESRVVNLRVRNAGGATSGPVTLTLPAIEWMRSTVGGALVAMAPDEAREFGLLLAPPVGVALAEFAGQFRIDDGEVGTTVPFRIRTISRAVGDLRIRAVDEVTFFDPAAPPVTNAAVTVRDAFSRALVTNGVTDGNGMFVARELPEAPYEIEVAAARHNTSRSSLLLVPGITNEVRAFLTRQTVTYRWTVVPTEIEDRTELRVEADFDAFVPLPVIDVEPRFIDLGSRADGSDPRSMDLLIRNRGLVKADNLRFVFPTNDPARPESMPGWRIEPLVWSFRELAAGGSYTVPIALERLLSRDEIACEMPGSLLWDLRIPQPDGTVQTNTYVVPIPIINSGRACGGNGGRPPIVVGGTPGGGGLIGGVSASVHGFTPIQEEGVPARIRLRLDQTAVLTREAFRATLEVGNQTEERLEHVGVRLTVRNEAGADAEALFAVRPPKLDGITGVDGAGILGPLSSGSAEWILVPTTDAAGAEPVVYRVSGELTYRHEGRVLTVPLAEVAITVHPSPRLVVQYFHERFVYSDDPFTKDVVEPAIPYVLGMLVRNEGFGRARNLRIRSGSPQILQNEQGLLIDFNILATQVNGRNAEPSLLADFGDIEPGATTSARWFLNSSLQGYFSGFTATFEHLDAVSGKALSLFDRVEIFELMRSIRDPRSGKSGQLGFLARTEVTNGPVQPLHVHLADGTVAPVIVAGARLRPEAPTESRLEVALAVPQGAGWHYFRMEDPEIAAGVKRFRVVSVRRPDGSELPSDNFWETDREFPGRFVRPLPENRLHIVDEDPPAQYTLVYREVAVPTDRVAPSSRVESLPTISGMEFTVRWSGADNAAVELRYDVYVAVEDGVFERWLTGVTRTSAVYAAEPGRRYRFYSRATDAAGNVEETPAIADAETTSSLVNTAPRLALVADVVIPEGAMLDMGLSATDDDVPVQALRYALVQGPAGMTIDPFNGRVRWETREVHGPSTNDVVVRAQDDGSPVRAAETAFRVVVQEVNRAPEVTPPDAFTAVEGRLLRIPIEASDPDVPVNTLRYRLVEGAPAGVRVDAVSGVLEWTPGEVQGGRVHRIGVLVADDGQPVAASMVFVEVAVRDTRSDFRVELGRTNGVAGAPGSVPLRVGSSVGLERLDLHLDAGRSSLSDFQLLARSTRVRSVLLQPEGSGMRATLTLGSDAGNGVNDVLADLAFVSGQEGSESVWLRVSDVRGVDALGTVLRGQGFPGRVFVVGREPLVDLVGEGVTGIEVYGLPGRRYVVESASTMDAATWTREGIVELGVGEVRGTAPITPGAEDRFYRARE